MNRSEKLALFLGMLSGDGCLSIKHNGQGYRDYPIQFFNTEKDKVELFGSLFYDLFELHGRISSKNRENRKEIWEFLRYSHSIVNMLKNLGFPEGVKRDVLRVLPIVKARTRKEKLAFIKGVILTDGCIRNNGRITFHSGSKLFLEDLSFLFKEIFCVKRPVKEYIQLEKYKSYQLSLNKKEGLTLLSVSPDGTMVLRES
jgi:hypothetical protein